MRLVLRLARRVLRNRASREGVHALVELLGSERILVDLGFPVSWVLIFFLNCVSLVVNKASSWASDSAVDSVNGVFEIAHLLVIGLNDGVHLALARAWI